MHSYVARQPIVDKNKELFAYELLFRDNETNTFPKVNPDIATSKIIAENELTMGLGKITDDKIAFINFPTDTLINNFPDFIDPSTICIEILEDIVITPALVQAVDRLHRLGYKFALDDYDFNERWQPLLPYASIVKVDIQQTNILQCMRMVRQPDYGHVEWLAEKVETESEFMQFSSIGFKYFQGYYFSPPEMLKKNKVTMSQHLIVEMITAISEPFLDYGKLETLFAKDITLTYKLLRYLNKAHCQLEKEIESIKHALAYLGDDEVKKYLSLLLVANLTSEGNNDVIKRSLHRAKFCELLLAKICDKGLNDSKAFLTGMMSQIDLILGHSLEHILEMLPLHSDIKAALLKIECDRSRALQLIKAMEANDTEQANHYAQLLELEKEDIKSVYMEASKWATSIL